jgi:hypothetical protein
VGRRSRKRLGAPGAAQPPPRSRTREDTPLSADAFTEPAPKRPRKSSEERNAEAREALEPLDKGERPRAVTVAAIVALILAIIVIVAVALGKTHVQGNKNGATGAILFAAVLLVAAGGMWRARYWAVLGFQALLVLLLIFYFLALLRVSNVLALAYCVASIVGYGALFWFLVKAMARIQMPERR